MAIEKVSLQDVLSQYAFIFTDNNDKLEFEKNYRLKTQRCRITKLAVTYTLIIQFQNFGVARKKSFQPGIILQHYDTPDGKEIIQLMFENMLVPDIFLLIFDIFYTDFLGISSCRKLIFFASNSKWL